MKAEEKVREFKKIQEAIKAGYGGVMKGTGTLVDRREHPEAQPIPENRMFDVPPPKEIPQHAE